MKRTLIAAVIGACASAFIGQTSAVAQPARSRNDADPARLRHQPAAVPVGRFRDTFAHGDLKLQPVYSCYLIKHGDEYMLWDTGHSMSAGAVAPEGRAWSTSSRS